MKYQLKPSRSLKKKLLIIGGGLLLLAMFAVFGLLTWYHAALKPVSSSNKAMVVVIEPGSSVGQIGDLLEQSNVIRSSSAFRWYLNGTGKQGKLQAGTYLFKPSQSSQEIADMIINGEVDSSLFTILPGYRVDQVRGLFIDAGFKPAEVDAALAGNYNHAILATRTGPTSLEGYLFPETYHITSSTTPEQVVKQALDQLNSKLTPAVLQGIEEQGLTVHEAITLASIIQKETSNPTVQRTVAQVFLKRLKEGMVLGSDVTFIYAAHMLGVEASPELDSPYNTRKFGGLPPGPIANFNFSALEAVANPTDTSYLFFVAGDDGTTHFSKTLSEHEKLVEQYCKKLCAE